MKHINRFYIAAINTLMVFLPAYCSEFDLGQTTISLPVSTVPTKIESTKKQKKPTVIRVRPDINEDFTKATTGFQILTSREKELKSLKEQINKLNESEVKKYAPIINPIQKNLQNPEKLKEDKIKLMNYSVRIIQEQDVQKIIDEIKKENLKLEKKLNILNQLYELKNPIFYEEPTAFNIKSRSERTQYTIAQDKEELQSWLNKKNLIQKAIEEMNPLVQIQHETEKNKTLALLQKQFTTLRHQQEDEEFEREQEQKEKIKQEESIISVPSTSETISQKIPVEKEQTRRKEKEITEGEEKLLQEFEQSFQSSEQIKQERREHLARLEKAKTEFEQKKGKQNIEDIIQKLTKENRITSLSDDERNGYIDDIIFLAKTLREPHEIDINLITNLQKSQLFGEGSRTFLANTIERNPAIKKGVDKEIKKTQFRRAWDAIKNYIAPQESSTEPIITTSPIQTSQQQIQPVEQPQKQTDPFWTQQQATSDPTITIKQPTTGVISTQQPVITTIPTRPETVPTQPEQEPGIVTQILTGIGNFLYGVYDWFASWFR